MADLDDALIIVRLMSEHGPSGMGRYFALFSVHCSPSSILASLYPRYFGFCVRVPPGTS